MIRSHVVLVAVVVSGISFGIGRGFAQSDSPFGDSTAGALPQQVDDPFAALNSSTQPSRESSAVEQLPAENPQIDYDGFVKLTRELAEVRAKRRVPLEEFLAMASEPGTILLDTRSKDAFERAHLSGAVHLNFSDFTTEKLAKAIPSKDTRILIYCNNNFRDSLPERIQSLDQSIAILTAPTVKKSPSTLNSMALASKSPVLALNIPTFINLHGYGYENIYELADVVAVDDSRVTFEGSAVGPVQQATTVEQRRQ